MKIESLLLAFDESEHPRGQPGNKGEFAPKGKGGAANSSPNEI